MAELIVEDKPIELSRFSDLTVNCSDYAEFKCYVSDPTAEGKWYKDGKEVRASDRIKFVDIECERKICIFDVQTSDIGEYEYRVKSGRQELSMTACLDAIEIIVEKPKEPPKLYLNLSASREIIIKAGNKLAVDIPISKDLAKRDGKQKFDDSDGKRIQGGQLYLDDDAKLEWTRQLRDDLDGDGKIDFDEYLPPEIIKENDDHIRIDNTHDKSSLILLNARRNDAGKYMLKERFSHF